jgi:hypothetical protein
MSNGRRRPLKKSSYMGNESEILLIPLRRFVDASRDMPERRPLSVSYRSGYHEDAPALDGLCKKAHFIIGGLNLQPVVLLSPN